MIMHVPTATHAFKAFLIATSKDRRHMIFKTGGRAGGGFTISTTVATTIIINKMLKRGGGRHE